MVDKNIAEVSDLELVQLQQFIPAIRAWLPDNMQALGDKLLTELEGLLQPLMNLGLDYLTLSRAGNTLSTGELQRIQLSRTLRTETTGVLYVLDEPSIGLHAANVQGLITIMKNLVEQGNSVVVVDHDPAIISAADHVIEIGPDSGELGGQVIAQGSVDDILADPQSRMAPFITGSAQLIQRPLAAADDLFKAGRIDIGIEHYHNIDHLETSFPVNRFTVVSGFSGAGKSTLVFDALIPALESPKTPPAFVDHIDNKKSSTSTPLMPRQSVRIFAPHWQPTPMCWMNCAICLPHCPKVRRAGLISAISPITSNRGHARPVMGLVKSIWISSICRICNKFAQPVMVSGTIPRYYRFGGTARTSLIY